MYDPPRDVDKFFASIPEGYWRMHNGQIIAIEDMDLKHLKNTIAMLERWGCTNQDKYEELVGEQEYRDDENYQSLL